MTTRNVLFRGNPMSENYIDAPDNRITHPTVTLQVKLSIIVGVRMLKTAMSAVQKGAKEDTQSTHFHITHTHLTV